jgi:uncharacterized protein with FMN-binding domain
MTMSRWRGTLIYTGTVAAVGAAAVTRFGPLAAVDLATSAPTSTVAASGGAGSASGSQPRPSASSSGPSDTAAPAAGSDVSSQVTVVGSVSETRYGPVQVSVTFDGARIVEVQTLRAPDSYRESQQISARAAPELAREVLAGQSSSIDTVSGATYTSQGYRDSVQFAIDQRG